VRVDDLAMKKGKLWAYSQVKGLCKLLRKLRQLSARRVSCFLYRSMQPVSCKVKNKSYEVHAVSVCLLAPKKGP